MKEKREEGHAKRKRCEEADEQININKGARRDRLLSYSREIWKRPYSLHSAHLMLPYRQEVFATNALSKKVKTDLEENFHFKLKIVWRKLKVVI